MASDFGNSKKRLLEESTEDETSIAIHERRYKVCDRLKLTILYLVLLSLVGSNYFFYSLYAQSRTQGHKLEPSQYAGYSTFSKWCRQQSKGITTDQDFQAGLTHDTPTSYHYPTEYISSNETFADKLWDEIDVSRLVVALSDEWAEEHGLQRSVFRFPWDEKGTGVYYLKIFHDLHCVVSFHPLQLLPSSDCLRNPSAAPSPTTSAVAPTKSPPPTSTTASTPCGKTSSAPPTIRLCQALPCHTT